MRYVVSVGAFLILARPWGVLAQTAWGEEYSSYVPVLVVLAIVVLIIHYLRTK